MALPTYAYCTIAVGEQYLSSALQFHNSVCNYPNCKLSLITTDTNSLSGIDSNNINEKISFDVMEPDYEFLNRPPGFLTPQFNYNVKHRPILKTQTKALVDYIIFVDADWEVTSKYDESGILLTLQEMREEDVDFLFERPHGIGAGKQLSNRNGCFWPHKIQAYGLMETDRYDAGDVCNEQYMIFANNSKLPVFVTSWMNLFNKSQVENIWAFAEGVEIGMSTAVAGMKTKWIAPRGHMGDYYSFMPRCGKYPLTRF